MLRKFLPLSLTCLALLLAPLMTLAQPAEGEALPLLRIYQTLDGGFRLPYPEGWELRPLEDTLLLANTAIALERNPTDLEGDQLQVLIFAASAQGFQLPPETSLLGIAEAVVGGFGSMMDTTVTRPAELTEMGAYPAAIARWESPQTEVLLILVELPGSAPLAFLAITDVGEMAPLRPRWKPSPGGAPAGYAPRSPPNA
ncbi:MAG: hypothetical protein HC915_17280, partial [Anaerolineae bacterium]|nr:hypothetical protein [Anaerolineae bacterium]